MTTKAKKPELKIKKQMNFISKDTRDGERVVTVLEKDRERPGKWICLSTSPVTGRSRKVSVSEKTLRTTFRLHSEPS